MLDPTAVEFTIVPGCITTSVSPSQRTSTGAVGSSGFVAGRPRGVASRTKSPGNARVSAHMS